MGDDAEYYIEQQEEEARFNQASEYGAPAIRFPPRSNRGLSLLPQRRALTQGHTADYGVPVFAEDVRVVELSGLQRPGDLVSAEDDAGRECFRADEIE